MRRISLAFLLVVLLLSVGAGGTLAQVDPPGNVGALGLDKPVGDWNDADLENLVDLIVDEKLTIQQSEIIYESLTEKQIIRVGELLGAKVGVSADEVREARAAHRDKDTLIAPDASSVIPCSGSYLWGCYPCEHNDLLRRPVHVWYHLENATECNSSDPDWLFKFGLDYGGDADSLRWRTASTQIWWAISICYPSKNLNSFNYSFNPPDRAYLVVGKTCVALGGGVNNFDSNLILGQSY